MQKIKKFIDFHRPSFGDEEYNAIVDTLKTGWVTTGPKSHEFEKNFSKFLMPDDLNWRNKNKCLSLNSCTAALHLSLLLLGLKQNDEIITTPLTFVATANVVEAVGAKLVLADIDPSDLNICPKGIQKKITKNTKAIILVHYGGKACKIDEIKAIIGKKNIAIIEDVAHGLGGTYKGQKLGTFGKYAAFSFYGNKNMTTADGGMLVANSEDIDKARVMSLHGIDKTAWKRYRQDGHWYYDVVYPGMKYNMTDISASIGIVQLKKLPRLNKIREKIATLYVKRWSKLSFFSIPKTDEFNISAWYNFPILLNLNTLKISRDEFIKIMKDYNIGSSVHFIPLHLHNYYQEKYNFKAQDFSIAYDVYKRLICVPLHPEMTKDEVNYVIETICFICEQNAK